ncbi:hypothetical protein [Actinopolymorpha rutila]|uniref:Uncharacterized protein n=1 Tax=Actinopolymorpha rutila TaxID=446787 RepID=A0A852ZD57_9ACTN|nr:hypothetical protein [Actinopolymorpha rutila]NYH91077.1 hypothetical protein [Actinopolymorpha rutila]
MAGLLNLLPRYLPRYGMAPHWARATRPMVLVLTAVAFLAVMIAARRAREHRWTIAIGVIAAVFVYTTLANVVERPDGVKIGACFIAAIIVVSFLSRFARAFELRVTDVVLDETAQRFVRDRARRRVRLIANEPDARDPAEYRDKIRQMREDHDLPDTDDLIFAEVVVGDPSQFESELRVHGEVLHNRYRVLRMESSTVPNALAALVLHIRDQTGTRPVEHSHSSSPTGLVKRYLP